MVVEVEHHSEEEVDFLELEVEKIVVAAAAAVEQLVDNIDNKQDNSDILHTQHKDLDHRNIVHIEQHNPLHQVVPKFLVGPDCLDPWPRKLLDYWIVVLQRHIHRMDYYIRRDHPSVGSYDYSRTLHSSVMEAAVP